MGSQQFETSFQTQERDGAIHIMGHITRIHPIKEKTVVNLYWLRQETLSNLKDSAGASPTNRLEGQE
jgi:hypothetical protein